MNPSAHLERDTSKYFVDGIRVPSVTEILQVCGFADFAGVSAEILEAAAQRGRAAHAVTADWDTGLLQTIDELPEKYTAVAPYLHAYDQFRQDTKLAPVRVEEAFVCTQFRFAGTVDRLFACPADPSWWILDLKTGQAQADYVALQLAGYEIGLQPFLRGKIDVRRYALRLLPGRTPPYSLKRFTGRDDHADFLAGARVTHRRMRMGGVHLAT